MHELPSAADPPTPQHMEIFILLVLMLVNGLFVMSEIALVSARKGRLESLSNKGDEKARAALELAENPEKFLSTAQIGITLVSILTGVYSGEKIQREPGALLRAFLKPFGPMLPPFPRYSSSSSSPSCPS